MQQIYSPGRVGTEGEYTLGALSFMIHIYSNPVSGRVNIHLTIYAQ